MILAEYAEKTNKEFKSAIERKIKEMFPIQAGDREIVLEKLTVTEPKEAYDAAAFEQKKLNLSSISFDVSMNLKLRNTKTNETIDSKVIKLKIPASTVKNDFLVKGNEYVIPTQLRLKPGIYTRRKSNGELVAEFKMEKGENFKIVLDPNKNTLRIDQQGRQIKLIPFLKGMGITEEQMRKAWGSKEFNVINQVDGKGDPQKEIQKVMEKDFSNRYRWLWEDIDPNLPPEEKVKKYMEKTELDSKITNITLGQEISKADVNAILAAVAKLIQISKGEAKESGMSSIVYKKAHKPYHHIEEKLDDMKNVLNSTVKKRMLQFDDLHKIISPSYTQKIFDNFFLTSSASQLADQPNVIGLLSNMGKVTLTGEGAIEEDRAVTEADRSVDPYHFLFLDPVHTPESEKIGSNLFATIGSLGSITNDTSQELKSIFYDLKTGQNVTLAPIDVYDKVVAFPNEIENKKPTGKTVKALHKGEIKNVKDTEVDLIPLNATEMFDFSSNLIPFLSSINGNRAMMASKHLTHAIPLADPESPLVQNLVPNTSKTFENTVGSAVSVFSPVDGTVTSVSDKNIKIKDNKGKIYNISLLDYIETGESTFLKHIPVVKKDDKVKKGQLIADSNMSKDGTLAIGKNLKVAYAPYKGFNYEDGIVISDTAAKKLSSEHLYNFKIEILPGMVFDKNKFRSYYPNEYTSQQLNNLDDTGIVKKGTKLKYGDPVATVLKERSQSVHEKLIGDLHKQLMAPMINASVEWDKNAEGEVVRVVRSSSLIQVMVRTVEPIVAGDKIVGRHGNKGTVAQIVPENEMPIDKSGEPIEVILNPAGIPSRINPSQVLETVAGKIAKKTGKQYNIENFKPNTNYLEQLKSDLKKNNLKDTEYLTDPNLGKLEKPVLTGYQYMVKLPQQVEVKTNIREEWGYDADKRPLRGSQEGGGSRALDPLTAYSLIAHDARANMREMATYKAEQNDEFWLAIENGQIPPAPKPTFAFNKFVGYLKGAGIDVTKSGNNIQLAPMKDKDILSMSNGEVKKPDTLKAYNLTPEKGGIFDVDVLGGLQGDKWGHINLANSIPNPTFERQIKKILNLTSREYEQLLKGEKGVDNNGNIVDKNQATYFAGDAFKKLLSKINPDQELRKIQETLKQNDNLRPEEIDSLMYKAKIFRGMKETGTKPEDYVISHIPVIPPKYRPVYPSQDDKFLVVSPINHLYKDTLLLNNQIKDAEQSKTLTKEEELKLVGDLYNQVKALVGIGSPLPGTQSSKEGASGALEFLAGTQSPKSGYFQSRLFSKRQELSSTAVIQNGPDLNLDEAAIPEEALWNLYRPFLIKKLQENGYNIKEAKEMIKNKDPMARKMLEEEIESRPVLLNRSPSLHKFSVMAFKPKITQDQVIRLNPNVVAGFNADYDGDTMAIHVPVTEEARQEALRMTPSKNLFRPGSKTLMNTLRLEYNGGIYNLTAPPEKEQVVLVEAGDYKTLFELLRNNKVKYNDLVKFNGKVSTVGRHLVNELFPEKYRDYNNQWNGKKINSTLEAIAKENPDKAVDILNRLKELSRYAMYKIPITVSLNDLEIPEAKSIKKEIQKIDSSSNKSKEEIVKELNKVDNQVSKMIDDLSKRKSNTNSFLLMKDSGTKGSTSQIKQLLVGPISVQNSFGDTIPIALGNSYSEGLTPAQYFAASYGARMGMLAKKLGVSEPGALNKEILNSVSDQIVSQYDDPNNPGIPIKISEEDEKDLVGRVLAKDVLDERGRVLIAKGETLTPHALSLIKNHKIDYINIKSPLTDTTPIGLSGTSFGLDENSRIPSIGTNLGVKQTQAITEPLSQGALNFFHTGGVTSTDSTMSTYEAINTMTKLTQTFQSNSAVLSLVTNTVEKINKKPLGGYEITIGGIRHDIPTGLEPKVKVGDKVKKGEAVSTGMVHPEEAYKARGLPYAEQIMARQFRDVLKQDLNIDSASIETLVKGLISTAQILDPGNHADEFKIGDVANSQYIDYLNRKDTLTTKKVNSDLIGWVVGDNYGYINIGTPVDENILKELQDLGLKEIKVYKQNIKFQPIIKGTTVLPHKKFDWLHRATFRNLKQVFPEEAAFGGKANIHGPSPLTAWTYGAEIRKDEKGQY